MLWAYGTENVHVHVSGRYSAYKRNDIAENNLDFLFCPSCGSLACWRAISPNQDGLRKMAVNLRLADPASLKGMPLRRFDGLGDFKPLASDGSTVDDIWF